MGYMLVCTALVCSIACSQSNIVKFILTLHAMAWPEHGMSLFISSCSTDKTLNFLFKFLNERSGSLQ